MINPSPENDTPVNVVRETMSIGIVRDKETMALRPRVTYSTERSQPLGIDSDQIVQKISQSLKDTLWDDLKSAGIKDKFCVQILEDIQNYLDQNFTHDLIYESLDEVNRELFQERMENHSFGFWVEDFEEHLDSIEDEEVRALIASLGPHLERYAKEAWECFYDKYSEVF